MPSETPASSFLLDPHTSEFCKNPFAVYAHLREHAPVYYWEKGRAWLVSRHADVVSVLRDPRLSTSQRHWEHAPPPPAHLAGAMAEFFSLLGSLMTVAPPKDHLRLRRLVTPAFSVPAIERLRRTIQRPIEEEIDQACQGDILDVRRELADRIPGRTMAVILGIPRAHEAAFRAFSNAVIKAFNPWLSKDDFGQVVADTMQGAGRIRELIEARSRDLGADLLSDLIRAEDAGDRLSKEELLGMVAVIIAGGFETTTHALCFAVRNLLMHPEERQSVAADPSLLGAFVEESLRSSPVGKFGGIPRYALEDIEIRGTPIRKGQMVQAVLGAAQRDPDAFSAPDVFDMRRDHRATVAFGTGPYYCLGAALARLELAATLEALLLRFPAMELITQELEFVPHPSLRDMASLKVALNSSLTRATESDPPAARHGR